MIKKTLLILLFSFHGVQAQITDYDLSATLRGLQSSDEKNPFWLYANQRGRIDEITDIAGWVTGSWTYFITPDSFIQLGLGGLFQNGHEDGLKFDEYYFSYENKWLLAVAGRKQRKELYEGLSATNENVIWSLNARPLPGFSFKTLRPISLWEDAGIGFTATWEEFFTHDDRLVEEIRIHHKSFHLVFSKMRNLELKMGFQHFVQWGGYSPDHGPLPNSLSDYTKIFFGRQGSNTEVGEEKNALGNHVGSYEIYLKTSYRDYGVTLIYNTFFEDGSGMMLRNTPDGRYGIFISDIEEESAWFNAFLYEYYFSRHQSKSTPTPDGKDNYFNHNLYRSGWTYEQRVLGLPFMMLDEDRYRIAHNNIVAHHVGLSGIAFYRYPYKLLLSYRENYGAKSGYSTPQNTVLSGLMDFTLYRERFNFGLQMGFDFDSEEGTALGLGFRLSKKFF